MDIIKTQLSQLLTLSSLLLLLLSCNMRNKWQLSNNHMYTKWANEVTPLNVLPEYPRPMMQREEWLNLNGLWEYAITEKSVSKLDKYDGIILVPFPVESALSGVKKTVTEKDLLWYRRFFEIPAEWQGRRILLNFGAVDWEAKVWINGSEIGAHKGGYDTFTFDITGALVESGEQELIVSVWDPTELGYQPKGKQTTDTHGFWYTAVTGIWQTVWLEPVELSYIKSLKLVPDIDNETITISADVSSQVEGLNLKVIVRDGDKVIKENTFDSIINSKLTIPDSKNWSPENPFLYSLQIHLLHEGEVVDKIDSYFGMRKISKVRDENGVLRMALNNKIYFQYGLLDQGWWPDGLYRAPTDEALKYDIKVAKKLGFNMLRKHGKMEPQRWYYWCDKIGILVWQDMTPGDIQGEYGTNRTNKSAAQFELEYSEMLNELYNFSCISNWIIFNEGWGQYDTERLVNWTKETDPTRLVTGASGFIDKGVGDVSDVHTYPGPSGAALEENRVLVLGEFGGLGYPVKGHLWNPDKSWGYVDYKNVGELEDSYENLLKKLQMYISDGLSAAIYTQVSDVENEANGMMTYDRAVIKMSEKLLQETSEDLYSVKPGSYIVKPLLPSSQEVPQIWRYTFEQPVEGWQSQGFVDSNWQKGEGGFGDMSNINPRVETEWTLPSIWLRKEFKIDNEQFRNIYLKLYHQFEQGTTVYLNGVRVENSQENFNSYNYIQLDRQLLNVGENLLTVYSWQNMRQCYIDAGLYEITAPDAVEIEY